MTLIKDLIDIPEHVHHGDFVLRLTEGVERPEETLRQYVPTPQLCESFDRSLTFIKSALDGRSSKACYLHGSFGAGKSHFMAVLHLLLQNNPAARSIPELAPVVAKHNAWTEGKRFLLVPYHMIGARSMEAAVLGHYAEHVRKLRPEAPVPGIYLGDHIFNDARKLRLDLGDEVFFEKLNDASGGDAGWGALGAKWSPSTFEHAIAAAPRSEDRARLVSDLVNRFFSAYRSIATGQEEAYVPLDDGLSIISRHAKALGYDAVVLFLDELILWLASHAADIAFVNREGQKLAKLVEAQNPDRPVPLVSFVARQRDVRELIGDHITGADQCNYEDVIKWWEARFHLITLEDRNLPAIVEKRILKPRSEAATLQLDQAFRETEKVRQEVMETLLTSKADRDTFRKVYPFSPALVEALVAVSSVLQRERTALKVMLQLLVEQRDELKLGDLVPVGDLFDVISEGDEPFSEGMRLHFENAKKLYHRKLRPMLEKEHNLRADEARGSNDGQAQALRNDDRLVKTLLLAALVPEVESFKGMTAGKLAALNHGTIRSPIAGREGTLVLAKCRRWASEVGEIKIGEESANPTISIQVTGVDTESIIEKAKAADSTGERRRKLREILFAQLGIEMQDALFTVHEITWRGTRRRFDIVFENVRELGDDRLIAADNWKLVLDFPFDPERGGPADDVARVEQFKGSTRTVVWLPAFFSRDVQGELKTLVILDHVLTGERFNDYASHLSAADRAAARGLLENRRSQLRERIKIAIEGAYGVLSPPATGTIDASHFSGLADQIRSLDQTFTPQPPVAANMGGALEHLLAQMLAHQFPAHPAFEIEPKTSLLKKVHEEIERAIQTPDGRIPVDKPMRPLLRQVANPLRIGTMHETHFILDRHWENHFQKKAAEVGGPMTVAKLRRWMDEPRPMGLPTEVQNFVICIFAAQTNRSFYLNGGSVSPSIEKLHDDLELREQKLPAADLWDAAVPRAASILGVPASPIRTATSVAKLVSDLREKATGVREGLKELARVLRDRLAKVGIQPSKSDRLRSANAVSVLVEALLAAPPDSVLDALARAKVETSETAMAAPVENAPAMVETLKGVAWDILEAVFAIAAGDDERAPIARSVKTRVEELLMRDEHVSPLGPGLRAAQQDAVRLLSSSARRPEAPPPEPVTARHARSVEKSQREGLSAAEAKQLFDDLATKLSQGRRRKLDLSWTIVEDEDVP